MSKDDSSNNILSKPEHVLTFIKHALQSDTASKQAPVDPGPRQGLTRDDLRIVPEEDADDDSDTEGDSDDETPSLQGTRPNDEMTITALNLLLSVLEGAPFFLQRPSNISLTVPISKSDPLLAVGPSSRRDSRAYRESRQGSLRICPCTRP
jgi:hypothetical protein